MLETVNGLDLVLAVLALAGWTAWRLERLHSQAEHARGRFEGRTEATEVYDWHRDGL